MIQEPWINKTKIKGIDENKYNLFYSKTPNMKPRTCIVTTKNVTAILMPQFSSGENTTTLLKSKLGDVNEEFFFCAVYLPYEERINIPDQITKNTIEHSSNSGIPLIIGADCNAHHTVWGSSDINTG